MKSFWQPASREEVLQRIRNLDGTQKPLWGKMNAGQMLSHISDQLRMALGDIPCDGVRGPFRHWPLNKLMIYVIPWPKGKAKGPREAFRTLPSNWQDDVAQFEALVRRFAGRSPADAWPQHPLFGNLDGKAYGVLCYRHTDHHLRQFGV